jgi:RNase P protein component
MTMHCWAQGERRRTQRRLRELMQELDDIRRSLAPAHITVVANERMREAPLSPNPLLSNLHRRLRA